MAVCDTCGEQENMPYRCRHCNGTYCGEHRLPESHDCPGLQNWSDPNGVFDSGFDDSVNQPKSTLQTRIGGSGPLSYFRGNMTYLFLALMCLTFFAQILIAPLIGIDRGTQLWYALFTLNPNHPLYVWTWITSIFAHGSLTHLFFNGIVLFFFGPIVERSIGSKKFAALFIVSGVLAGFAQIGLGFLVGSAVPLLGASGAIMAVMGLLTVLDPDLTVYLWFFLPVPIWLLTIGYAVFSVFGFVVGFGGNVAHMAHLAGLITGLIYGQHVKSQGVSTPGRMQLGPGQGPGGPGRGRGPF